MTPDTIPQTVLFPDLFDKPLVATFNQEHASSDGGAVLLKAAERRVWLGQGVRPVSGRQTRTGEDSAHARGPDRPAGLRHRVRSSRWQRCRPLGRRPHPQAAARAGPGVRRALGVATHDLAIRERRAPQRALPDGARVGGVRHRTSSASPAGAGAAHHHRSGPDRRPDARRPAAHVLQRALWRLVLSADAGVSELRPRGGAVSVARRCCGPGRQWPPTGPSACCLGCSRCCGPRFRGRGFSFGSTGALRPRRSSISWMRSPGSTTSWRWRRTRCCSGMRSPPCRWPARRARSVARPRTSIPTPATPPARGNHERRVVIKAEVVRLGDPRAAGQPAVRGDESAADAALHL